ncbi:MAG: DUF4274 domain-containing protein [Thermonemataceae bacterium]
MPYYKNRDELHTKFFPLQKAAFKFYTDEYFNEKEVNERAQELFTIIDEAFDQHNLKGYYDNNAHDRDYLKKIVQHQLDRINNRVPIDVYKTTQPEAPFVRIGPVDHELEQQEYDWFQNVCNQQGMSTQAWVSSQIIATALYRPIIENKHWVEFHWGIRARGNDTSHLVTGEAPDFSGLTHLATLFVSSKTPELTVSSDSLTYLSIGGDIVQKLTLLGQASLQKLHMDYLKSLNYCDISSINVADLWDIDTRGTKNLTFHCTEAQYKYCEALRKSRTKKTQIPSTSAEIDKYAAYYNWDGGYSFLNWVIKHPKCELATALNIYWLGSPLYFAGKEAEQVESYNLDNYKLLKTIEKRVLKKKYVSNQIAFDATASLDKDELEKARKSIAPELFQAPYSA